jgi:protocatechuate 3,4-dioxygenase, beta subunit
MAQQNLQPLAQRTGTDEISAAYRGEDDAQPPLLFPPYASTVARSPREPLLRVPQTPTEQSGPNEWEALFGAQVIDLTRQHARPAMGQRIIVCGQVLDEDRWPVPSTLIEIWQANAAGRYAHERDQWDAPLDENFSGAGRVVTDAQGRYRYITVRPGAYPWGNHYNAWRPAHIHLSLLGPAFATRLITQMYFPDDPLIEIDPIANSVPRAHRARMVAHFDIDITQPSYALGYRFDIVLRGRAATPLQSKA